MWFRGTNSKRNLQASPREIRYGEYTEQEIADILSAYGRQMYEQLTSVKDPSVEVARERIARAEAIVGSSGVGAALAPVLVEHVMHWHAWITRDDFLEYVGFPATGIYAEQIEVPGGARFAERIAFTYGAHDYSVEIVLEAKPSWDDDKLLERGKISLFVGDVEAIGVDMSLDLANEHAVWRWKAVSAFVPGLWMKDVIEIGAHIEASRINATQALMDGDVLTRSGKIGGI